MKASQIFSIITLLSSSVLGAPSQVLIKDEQPFNSSVTSTDNRISTGSYMINSPFFDDKSFRIGRGREDLSLLPKRIVSISQNAGFAQLRWIVQELDNGNYYLKIGGAPTAQIDSSLFALLIDGPEPTIEWKIDYQERHQAYTISRSDNYQGWIIAGQEEETQVQVKPLIVGPSYPPFYPPTELFTFEPLDGSGSIDGVFHEKHSDRKEGVHVDITVSIEGEL